MRIYALQCNYQKNPIGIELSNLTFSWSVDFAPEEVVQKSRFLLSDDRLFQNIIFDSKESPDTDLKSYAYSPDLSLQSGKKYYWKIQISNAQGQITESEIASVEGGHPEGAWIGKWIKPPFSRELHPILRKSFHLGSAQFSELQAARLYILGLGLYEAYLNGKKIGEEFLTPYCTDYRYWAQYQTYDVTALLCEGENILDVWLGNGWYKGRFGYLANGQLREYYGDEFSLLADLFIVGESGQQIIATDTSWISLKSPVVISGIYDGEIYDARKEEALRNPTKRDVSPVVLAQEPNFNLSPMVGVPVVAHEQHPLYELIHTPAGEWVLDFGQVVTGWVEFTVDASLDARILLEHGEVLQQGNFYNENLRTADAIFKYISSGKKERVRPHFTFYGFRYVRVTGMSKEDIRRADFVAVSLYSNLEEIGFIETGNAKINRLIENTKWSMKGNFLDVPTDCPQRDERCGWTGDAQIFSASASYHMQTSSFFRKYLKDMLYEQKEKDGAVPYVVPDILTVGREKLAEPPFDMSEDLWGEAGAAVWGDAATIIPWTMYLHSGNVIWLEEQYENMKLWTDFIKQMDEKHCGGKRLWTCGFHFGDWLSLDVAGDVSGMDNREGGTDKHFVASIYYMYSAYLTAQAAKVLGKADDFEYYQKLSDEVRAAILRTYVKGLGELSIRTQTAYVLGIHFHLFDSQEAITEAGRRLHELVAEREMHLATGFVGTAYICSALAQSGFQETAYTLLLNEDYPSWLYEVNLGATTIWERWNSILPDGRISGTGMNSLNHYAYGCIVQWIYEEICGLKISRSGIFAEGQFGVAAQTMLIAPHSDLRLGRASARVSFAAGVYESGWEYFEDGKSICYRFKVPAGCQAKFVADQTLYDIRLNGEVFSSVDLLQDRIFSQGSYVVEASLA